MAKCQGIDKSSLVVILCIGGECNAKHTASDTERTWQRFPTLKRHKRDADINGRSGVHHWTIRVTLE